MADQDQDPFASIATPIAAAPATRQPLRNPRIAGNEPDPFASIATPIATAPAAPPKQPTLGEVLTQDTDKTDAEYKGYKGAAGVAGATVKGLDDVARGTKDAIVGAGNALIHPIDTIKSLATLPDQAKQVPAAIKDINQSPDPLTHYADAAQDTASQGAGQALTALAAGGLKDSAPATKVIPKPSVVAGTKLPETVGQAASRVNPTGIASDVKGLEDMARKIPGSGSLRDVSTAQQSGAREILANKATEATGAQTSAAPDAIEQNARNAAEAARTAGNAKYQAIGKAAADADLTKTVEAAHSILEDEATMKLLPKSAREALGKVASSMSEREEIAHQIYGQGYADLDPTKQTQVIKAMGTNPTGPVGFQSVLDARSELGAAANASRDAADARILHIAHDQFGQAVSDTLGDLDKTNGTDHVAMLKDADKTWSQKYAFENFTEELQKIMQDREHGAGANREINGADFQKLINKLDPRGQKPGAKSPLQRMFPDDPQSVQDMHELADFMGRNQASAGGLAAGMAKLRYLGLKESALALTGTVAGFSWLMSSPGFARTMLRALTAGKDVAKASAAIGAINHAVGLFGRQNDEIGRRQNDETSGGSGAPLPPDNPPSINSTPSTATPTAATTKNATTPAANSNPSSITPSVPRGRVPVSVPGTHKLYHFPNQKAADDFKKAAGIQ